MSKIENIYISPAHNFFGHHGGPADQNPVVAVPAVMCVAGKGLQGDRFWEHKPDYKGQITFFAMEVWEQLQAELRVPALEPGALRRNVYTRGLVLPDMIGQEFVLQGIRFFGVEECRPCYWMDQAIAAGAEAWLQGRGGLRAKILTDGKLQVDKPGRA